MTIVQFSFIFLYLKAEYEERGREGVTQSKPFMHSKVEQPKAKKETPKDVKGKPKT